MGLVATRSIDEEVGGIKEILKNNRKRIKRGMIAYDNLQKIRQDKNDAQAKSVFE